MKPIKHLFAIVAIILLCSAITSNASTMYMVERVSNSLYTLDTTTGTATLVGDTGIDVGFAGLAYDSTSDTFLMTTVPTGAFGDASLYRVNPNTGAAALIGATGIANLAGLAFNPMTGLLFAVTGATNSLYTINPSTAATTLVGSVGLNFNVNGLAYDQGTGTLYANELNSDSLYTLSTATGAASLVGANGVQNIIGLGINPSGNLFGVSATTDSLYAIDKGTGLASLIGTTGVTVSNTGLAYRNVPESGSTLAMLGLVTAGLVGVRRRRS